MERMTTAEARWRPVGEGVTLAPLKMEAGDFIWTPPGESHTLHAKTEVVIHVVLPGPVVVTE